MPEVQCSFTHFTQQPQSVMWHLQYALDNASRQGTMQCQEICGWQQTPNHLVEKKLLLLSNLLSGKNY